MGTSGPPSQSERSEILRVLAQRDTLGTPLTTNEVADAVDCDPCTAATNLEALSDQGELQSKTIGGEYRVWWQSPAQPQLDPQNAESTIEHAQFHELVKTVTDYAIFVLDPDGYVQTWNEGAKHIKGYDDEEIVGEHFSAFYTAEDRDAGAPSKNLEAAAASGRVEDDGERVRKDGSRFWANVTITAIRDDDGDLQGFIKVTRDMTERHEYEERLRKQRDELSELDQINAVIRDIDQALVTATSQQEIEQAVCDRLAASGTYAAAWTAEYSDDYTEVTPRAWANIDEEYLDAIRTANAETATDTEKGVGAMALKTQTIQPVQRLHHDRGGEPWRGASVEEGYESAITAPLVYNEAEYGVLTVYAENGSAFDERKIEVLSELGETISYAIAAVRRKEREQTLTALQESTRKLLNTETETEIGDIIVESLTDDAALADAVVYRFDADENALEPVSSSLQTEQDATRLTSHTADSDSPVWQSFQAGEPRFTESSAAEAASEDRRTMIVPLGEYGALAVTEAQRETFAMEAQDLVHLVAATAEAALKRTERERRLQRQNEQLDNFASMLAHELRNPVTIGQIYSQQLPAETDTEAVAYVTEAFDRIEDMIDIMLVLTRGSEAVGTPSAVDLPDAARDAWSEVDAPEARLDVEIDRTIQTDETYIRHLFRNLFENSVEHGSTSNRPEADDVHQTSSDAARQNPSNSEDAVEHGGSDVTVTVGELENGFYVADDGVGIPAEEQESVFEEGYTTAGDQGGTGLGLAFVNELAAVYEWQCEVTESAAGGARFEFRNVL